MMRKQSVLLHAAVLFSCACSSWADARYPAPWLGVHVMVGSGDKALELTEVIDDLAQAGINALIVEVNYGYAYKSHPELSSPGAANAEQIRKLVAACRANGIRLIPQFQCLGHQSWDKTTFTLLTRYPQFDETPGKYPKNEGIYCRSWCPLHPDVNPIIFDLMDELIDVFEADALHVGMDEVFLIGDDDCPRCKGRNKAELFAKAVNDYHAHLVGKRKVEMLMWGDRLIDAAKIRYGVWEASANGTAPAVDLIPKDIIICDWHYEKRSDYASIPMFAEKGFRVWPASWRKPDAAKALIDYSQTAAGPKVMGHLNTTWGAVPLSKLAEFEPLRLATAAWKTPAQTNIDPMIRRHRMGELIIEAAPGATVKVEQVRHAFWFGAALANSPFSGRMDPQTEKRYKETFLANFNAAVTENALKWLDMEPRQGQVNYATVDAMLAWCDEHGIPLRGHNIFWGISNRVQPWLKEMDDDTLRQTLKDRATTIATRYKGRFAEYDLNNEMIHGNYYADRLGPGITRQMTEWVRQADPYARLYLNDYDILTGRRLDDYMRHIRGFLDEGTRFDGIGVQGHLHGDSFDPDTLRRSLDELAKVGLPIRITEFNFPGQRSRIYQQRGARLTPEEEEAKAKAITDYYRICFAHPAVEGTLMWGFWEGANWIPQSSLYRRDWTPTPAAEAYRRLIFDEWWTRWQGKADKDGRCRVPAFYGRHRVTVDGQEKTVDLAKSAPVMTISFR